MERIKWTDEDTTLKLFHKYMVQNKPCLFESPFTKSWQARKLWIRDDGSLNIDYLLMKYGKFECPVIVNDDSSQCKMMSVEEFIREYVLKDKKGYLKDWHFQSLCDKNEIPQVYELFSIFKFDWINNERHTTTPDGNPFGDDYRFLYLGTKGTWTGFHCDVMGSFSWSANVVGKKVWYFVPIGNEKYFLKDGCKDIYINDIRERKDLWKESGVFEVVQNCGEVIFVPSGMWHQVHNMDLTLSLNHNFINASNIDLVFDLLNKRKLDVEKEIEDVISLNIYTKEEVNNIIEGILRSDLKINFKMFYQLIGKIRDDRLNYVLDCNYNNLDPMLCIDDVTKENVLKISKHFCSCNGGMCGNCYYFMMKLDLEITSNYLRNRGVRKVIFLCFLIFKYGMGNGLDKTTTMKALERNSTTTTMKPLERNNTTTTIMKALEKNITTTPASKVQSKVYPKLEINKSAPKLVDLKHYVLQQSKSARNVTINAKLTKLKNKIERFVLQRIVHIIFIKDLIETIKHKKYYPQIYKWKKKFEEGNFSEYGSVALDPIYVPIGSLSTAWSNETFGVEGVISSYFISFKDKVLVKKDKSRHKFDIFALKNPYISFRLNVSNYPKNCYDEFWEMIFNEDITAIFAILSSGESDADKTFSYYFPERSKKFNLILVEKEDTDEFLTEYYIFKYKVTYKSTVKEVTIYYVYHWKPWKIPYTDKCIIELYDIMRNLPENSNVLIHSEGNICTRVSSVIYFLSIYEELINNPSFDNPMAVIKKIREEIPGGYIGIGDYNIIMKGIYELLYLEEYITSKAAYERIDRKFDTYRCRRRQNKTKFEGKLIPFLEFACDLSYGRMLEIFYKSFSIRRYDAEALTKLCSRFYQVQKSPDHCLKNNYRDIPCQDEFTVDCANIGINENGIDGYVHANIVEYKIKNNEERKIIMMQTPQKDVCDDLIELIYCHDVPLVINLTTHNESLDQRFSSYVPSTKGGKLKMDEFIIEATNVEINKETGFKISFCNVSTKFLPPKNFIHVLINTYYNENFVTKEKVIVDVYSVFLKYQKPTKPTVIHCNDGITRTGILTLFIHILDTLGQSETFDILTHLYFIRSRRLNAVPSIYQLFFTIQCLYEYFKLQLCELNPSVYNRLNDILKEFSALQKS
uniref:Jumonji domain-containing protein 4 n=1 Tax=Strongyloides stercoralis TaxID=6248 RepID=A0AAF5I255_STRER